MPRSVASSEPLRQWAAAQRYSLEALRGGTPVSAVRILLAMIRELREGFISERMMDSNMALARAGVAMKSTGAPRRWPTQRQRAR